MLGMLIDLVMFGALGYGVGRLHAFVLTYGMK